MSQETGIIPVFFVSSGLLLIAYHQINDVPKRSKKNCETTLDFYSCQFHGWSMMVQAYISLRFDEKIDHAHVYYMGQWPSTSSPRDFLRDSTLSANFASRTSPKPRSSKHFPASNTADISRNTELAQPRTLMGHRPPSGQASISLSS
jgi:hypothetical protein